MQLFPSWSLRLIAFILEKLSELHEVIQEIYYENWVFFNFDRLSKEFVPK